MARCRYAPSPTGDLHAGNVRTALLAWLQCRRLTGRFVMRIEDLDLPRVVPGAEERQLEALRRLGLTWDEGPDVGGPVGPYRQSERNGLYAQAVDALTRSGLTYRCFCSRRDIQRATLAPHGSEGAPYPGTCRDLGRGKSEALAALRSPCVRFRVPPGIVRFEDGVRGAVTQDVAAEVGDFVLQRADGLFAYQLAVVVDDIAMRISHVLRGEDLCLSTPRQLLLYRAFGAVPPMFYHVSLVYGRRGRLSKRSGDPSILKSLRDGADPAAILAHLAQMSGLSGATLAGMIEQLDLARLPRQPAYWDDSIFSP